MNLSSAIEKQVLAAAVVAPAPAPDKTPVHRFIRGAEPGCEKETTRARRRRLEASRFAPPEIADGVSIRRRAVYRRNIENYVGTVKVPVGIVGPLPVNGRFAEGGFMVPLATTEATLIASYNRGAKLLTRAGGAPPGFSTRGSVARRASCSPRRRRRSSSPAGLSPRSKPSGRRRRRRPATAG